MSKKIIMMGTPEFAVASLDALLRDGVHVAAVVTAPDRPAGRGRRLRQSPMKERAVELGIPVLQPERLKSHGFLDALQAISADLFVVVAFRMLPEIVWSMPPLGTINLHASLLPDLRGAAPINRAIMLGYTQTGLTTFFIQQEIDTGDIIDQVPIDIGPDENAGSLHDRMRNLGAELLSRSVHKILSAGSVTRRPQHSTPSDKTFNDAPKILREDRRIDWSLPVMHIHNKVRGLSPYPGAFSTLVDAQGNEQQIKILKTAVSTEVFTGAPGTLLIAGGRLFVRAKDASIEILEMQPEGKRPMNSDEFLRGSRSIDQQFMR